MTGRNPIRSGGALAIALLLGLVFPVYGQQPVRRPAPPPQNQGARPGGQVRGEHLSQWMQNHSNLNPQQQQNALRNEPGFKQLPPEVQSRVMNRLGQLNSMPPAQRQRVINRAEAMERLQPEQRQQVRGALGQLGSLPEDRRRMVARAFRDLRAVPPAQRQQMLSSPNYRNFTDQERSTLNNLLQAEPYIQQMQHP